MHPLVDIKKMPADELQNKIQELTRRYIQSQTANASASSQILLLLESYKQEMITRTIEKEIIDDPYNKSGVVLDTGDNKEKEQNKFDKLIDIG